MTTPFERISASPLSLVVVATPGWEERFNTSIMELCRELADEATILFVENPHTIRSLAAPSEGTMRKDVARILGLRGRIRREEGKRGGIIHVLTPPPVLPSNFLPKGRAYSLVMGFNAFVVRRSIRRAMRNLDIERPIVINAFNPTLGVPLAGRLGERTLVYYCYDEIRARPWNGRHGALAEIALIQQADLVLTTSAGLFASRSPLHPRTVMLKNGVDFDLFSGAQAPLTQAPDRRVAGYIGSLDDRIDYELLQGLCTGTPDIDYVFVGRITEAEATERLAELDNVSLVGPRPPTELPGFLSRMDVGLIPFVCDEFTRNIYPLKINEYLAAGKPVVRTPFAELPEFDGVVATAHSTEEFIAATRAACADDGRKATERIAVARSNSWTERATSLRRILHQQGA